MIHRDLGQKNDLNGRLQVVHSLFVTWFDLGVLEISHTVMVMVGHMYYHHFIDLIIINYYNYIMLIV